MGRLLLADDHDLVRETIADFLRVQGGFVAEVADNFDAAISVVGRSMPFDLVLLDFQMPGMDGLTGLSRMKTQARCPVAILSGTAPPDVARRALRAGAAGFLPKTLSAKSLVNAVRFMAMGEQYAPLDFMRSDDPGHRNPLAEQLSRRELEVLEGLTRGKSNKEIARDLQIRESTVKLHVKTLYRKINAANRTHAAIIAKEAGLF